MKTEKRSSQEISFGRTQIDVYVRRFFFTWEPSDDGTDGDILSPADLDFLITFLGGSIVGGKDMDSIRIGDEWHRRVFWDHNRTVSYFQHLLF